MAVFCKKYGNECVCSWPHGEPKSFDNAMATCLSEGGTLFYPNNRETFKHLQSVTDDVFLNSYNPG